MSLGGDRYTRHPARAVERFAARRVLGADAGRPACITLRARPHGRRGKRHGNRAASRGIGTLDHNSVGPVARDDLLLHARRTGLTWLIWEGTQLGERRPQIALPGHHGGPRGAAARRRQLRDRGGGQGPRAGDRNPLGRHQRQRQGAQNGRLRPDGRLRIRALRPPAPRPAPPPSYQLAGWGRYEPICSAWGAASGSGRSVWAWCPSPWTEEAGRGALLRFFGTDGVPLPHLFEEVAAKWPLERAWVTEQRARVQTERALSAEQQAREQTERTLVAEQQAREQSEAEREAMRTELAQLRSLLDDQARGTES